MIICRSILNPLSKSVFRSIFPFVPVYFVELPNFLWGSPCVGYLRRTFLLRTYVRVYYKKGHTRLAVACDKVYQLLAHAYGRWFSQRILPASSTTKSGRHDIAEILLKVAFNTKNQSINQIIEIHQLNTKIRSMNGGLLNYERQYY